MRFKIHRFIESGWEQIRLEDSTGGLSATIIPAAGGILNALSLKKDGHTIQVIDGYRDADEWKSLHTQGFRSAKLSPFVCRILNGRYTWKGKEYQLEKFLLKGSALHGLLFDAPFEVIENAEGNQYAGSELKYVYQGTDPGYPFSYDCYIRYRLEDNNTLSVVTAIHNRSNTAIPIADGWHPYFSFGGPIDNLLLTIHSHEELEYDEQLIPTGKLIPTDRWQHTAPVGSEPIDNGYLLDFTRSQPMCTLKDPVSGTTIGFIPDASYPYLQLYTPPHRRSIAIENLSAAPDALNNKMGLIILEPDHTKKFTVKYRAW